MPEQPLTVSEQIQFKAFSCSAWGLGQLGPGGLRVLSAGIGAILWRMLSRRRELAIRNIKERLCLPETEALKTARSSFTQNMQSFLDCSFIPHFTPAPPQLVIENPDILKRVLATDSPVVISTAHLGAWELLATLPAILGRPGHPCAVVVRHYKSRPFNKLMTTLRGSWGVQVIGHRNAVKGVLSALRKKGSVAFLVDHHAGSDEALSIPFLGKTAAVNMGPAVLALRTQAIILPLAVIREEHHYRLHMEEPLDTRTLTGSSNDKILAAATFYTKAVENMIRIAPDQWFWMHNRWK